ncbi:MAG: NAD-dependent epimerase/dehydratase family protein [Xanthomonadales bacterium]|nr:NAD-dependent epimerase/dehydratase family protein [Xanthomonadales bacterium]
MKILVTGSSGHLGEALVRTFRDSGQEVIGLDIKESPFTTIVGSVHDGQSVKRAMAGVQQVFHTATLHKPHVVTHSKQDFVDTNVSGTLVLLEEAVANDVGVFVFTSTTSMFGDALRPPSGTPAAWVTEDVKPIPKNIYGVTKTAAEDLCKLFHRQHGLNCIILRTSRFFPEEDDDKLKRAAFSDENTKANEYLFRRVELEDVVSAHIAAANRASDLGFGRYIISATTPFQQEDLLALNCNAPEVLRKRVPAYYDIYQQLGWIMFDKIDRVYVNDAARADLGWKPKYDFTYMLECLKEGSYPLSPISKTVGSKGYHKQVFKDGPFPVS